MRSNFDVRQASLTVHQPRWNRMDHPQHLISIRLCTYIFCRLRSMESLNEVSSLRIGYRYNRLSP